MQRSLMPFTLVAAGACALIVALVWEGFTSTVGAVFPALHMAALAGGRAPDAVLLVSSIGLCLAGMAWLLMRHPTPDA